MIQTKAVMVCCCAALTLGALARSAAAIEVTIDSTSSGTQTTGSVFDSKGFELNTVNAQPTSPTPSGATWEATANGAAGAINVVSGDKSSIGGPTKAYEGSNYLQIQRTSAVTQINADFDRDINPPTDKFTLKVAVWMPSFSNNATVDDPYVILSLQPSNGTSATSTPATTDQIAGFGFRYNASGAKEVVRYTNAQASTSLQVVSGATFNDNGWNTLEFTWDPTAADGSKALLVLNGDTAGAINVQKSVAASIVNLPVGQLVIRHNQNNAGDSSLSAVYIDSIPEPGAASLLVGGAVLLATRRRKICR